MNDTKQLTRVWHSGPPPHVGWWNASIFRFHEVWRWWDGKSWSIVADETDTASQAADSASYSGVGVSSIEWTDYWPAGARLPRIDPRSKT